MNNETQKAIELLAQKLGTTSEYLWGILLSQAPIDATMHVVYLFLSILLCFALYRIHKYLMNDDNEISYYNYEGLEIFMIIVAGLVSAIFAALLFTVGNALNGFFNPEFWALNYVMNHI